ncbi:16S rRNA (uracil1498-N3)-methyltransferase [Herbihabitans rhizosphaerae]|uniref:Ribosomal RNA small subunit methyltransferase E n=1 Tax=Herbihabitans rhizosphaerae TaxID=1872711 RepID=A0A4Q7KB02_9PSEU|nr:16S rRNA (uracil(1498)-N(3))-methyltransferase [Herbihabitans rhizosphaerae]RZS29616.1 16S rRNA (uracil1498-N3)-methyltransferase [Herbihabitans rhizosphaerae]
MSLPVFLVDELPAGGHTVLGGAEGRHAATVRRLRVGEELLLSNGSGGMARCTVAESTAGRKRDELLLLIAQRWSVPPPSPRVVVVQALAKGDRGELAVELATEAGADEIVPWRASRCVVRWDDGPRGEKALGRWRDTAREAAKQSRRAWIPSVTEPASTAEIAARISGGAAAMVLDASAEIRVTDADLPAAGDLLVVVGPEGGIAPDELDTLAGAGAQVVRLGPTVLRTSTAAAVTLGALGALTARWR